MEWCIGILTMDKKKRNRDPRTPQINLGANFRKVNNFRRRKEEEENS